MNTHTKQIKHPVFSPKFFDLGRWRYSRRDIYNDVLAGIVVGIVALPLSIAFAIASGVKPEQGLITAIIAGFLISVFSGSRVQIGGPTGAFIVIVYGIVAEYGYEGLALATVMAGIMLILLGVSRLGEVIKYMPYPVTVGFTSGIALIIFTTQIADFLGLKLAHVPEHFWQKWAVYVFNFTHLNPYALVIGVIAVFVVIFCPKKIRHVPPPLIALVVSTAIVQGLGWPVETIGSRFGEVSNRFPPFQFPAVTWELIVKMSPAAMAIALLAGIESLLSAVVADGMIGTRHRSNTELIAQGIANIASPLWGGIPATGAIARTATNIKLGGRSPIAGIVHAVTILLIFLFLAPWAALIPMPALAGILIVVAYNMSEWQVFVKLFRSPKSDILVLLTTFLLTIFVDLTAAIEVGVVLAAFLFMRRMIAVTEIGFLRDDENDEGVARPKPPEGVEVFEINGPFFFGAADKFRDTMHQLEKPPHVLILLMRAVPAIDATGLRALEDLLRKAKKDRMAVVLCGVPPHPKEILYQSGVVEGVGKENVCDRLDDAINRAREIIGK